jgi:RloB-like protein
MTDRNGREAAGRSLKRKVAVRKPRKTLLVICEGTRTEPDYLRALKQQPTVRDVAAVDLRVETGKGKTDARSLISIAVAARNAAINEEGEIDEFWCVFDVEWPATQPGLGEAVEQAIQNDIHVAISNPCFELWLILHFQDHNSWLSNSDACRMRTRLDGSRGKGLSAGFYMPQIADAARRAKALDKRHRANHARFPRDNPSSGMHFLLTSIQPTQPEEPEPTEKVAVNPKA